MNYTNNINIMLNEIKNKYKCNNYNSNINYNYIVDDVLFMELYKNSDKKELIKNDIENLHNKLNNDLLIELNKCLKLTFTNENKLKCYFINTQKFKSLQQFFY